MDAFKRNAEVDAKRVQVEANRSEVILKGSVRSWIEREEAERVAWSAPGVTKVEDRIVVSRELPTAALRARRRALPLLIILVTANALMFDGAEGLPRRSVLAMTEAQELATFVDRARVQDLSAAAMEQLKIRVLDTIGVAIAALAAPTIIVIRDLTAGLGGRPVSTLIGGGKTAPDRAAFFNGALSRYLDFMDSYIAFGETRHPSDLPISITIRSVPHGIMPAALWETYHAPISAGQF